MILRLKFDNTNFSAMAAVANSIAQVGGEITTVNIVESLKNGSIRDISVRVVSPEHAKTVIDAVKEVTEVKYIDSFGRTFLIHQGGKIEVQNRIPLNTTDDLSRAYTPGVAEVCMAIHHDVKKAWDLTIKKNCVAVVTDGTAVLGLGDIGPEAALPVMEGKAMLFKKFAGVNAWPICLNTKDTEEIIRIVKALAPGFGGINLEDISAPRCFEIERRLQAEMDIPVFHDDQHGTAVVTTAAFINAIKLVNKKPQDMKIVVSGVGAAGTACTKMLMQLGVRNIIGCDRQGALYPGRSGMNSAKEWFAENTNPDRKKGTLKEMMSGADLFLGLSSPGLLDENDLKAMNKDPIVFAMANPTPEIMPEKTYGLVAVMATGRSDYPNQINNVLCFPGIFRGALDCLATTINEEMKMAAAMAIAEGVQASQLIPEYIIPSTFDETVVPRVAKAVIQAAIETGVARKMDLI
ncbi:MAG: NAD-dependent malic enzyme [SAR324 cluster bacterium]|nr:NAD-dependent malic enzyme [SAR324 cluster bacterium]